MASSRVPGELLAWFLSTKSYGFLTGAKIEADERFCPDNLTPFEEFIGAELISLDAVPCQLLSAEVLANMSRQ